MLGCPPTTPARSPPWSGTSYPNIQGSTPGTTHYITLLEHGYARHELTLALLFLVLFAIPFRRCQRWAWCATWILSNIAATVDLPSSARPVR